MILAPIIIFARHLESCQRTSTQGPDDTIAIDLEHFTSLVKVLEHYGGAIGEDPGLFDPTDASSNATQR